MSCSVWVHNGLWDMRILDDLGRSVGNRCTQCSSSSLRVVVSAEVVIYRFSNANSIGFYGDYTQDIHIKVAKGDIGGLYQSDQRR